METSIKKTEYKIGIKTRNVILSDYQRLYSIIHGNYPLTLKKLSVIEFLKFYDDDAYFIFDRADIKPFLSLFVSPILRRRDKLLNRKEKPT